MVILCIEVRESHSFYIHIYNFSVILEIFLFALSPVCSKYSVDSAFINYCKNILLTSFVYSLSPWTIASM